MAARVYQLACERQKCVTQVRVCLAAPPTSGHECSAASHVAIEGTTVLAEVQEHHWTKKRAARHHFQAWDLHCWLVLSASSILPFTTLPRLWTTRPSSLFEPPHCRLLAEPLSFKARLAAGPSRPAPSSPPRKSARIHCKSPPRARLSPHQQQATAC